MTTNLLEALQELEGRATSSSARQMARQLVIRLSAPIQVTVFGPYEDANALLAGHLQEALKASGVEVAKGELKPIFDETDIAVWCSLSFGPDEAALWDKAPEALKDQSFLILITDETSRPQPRHPSNQFDETITIPMQDDEAALKRLSSKLQRRVQSAREADMDRATWLLGKYAADAATAPVLVPVTKPNGELFAVDTILAEHSKATLAIEEADDSAYAKAVLATCNDVAERLIGHFDSPECPDVPTDLKDDAAQVHDDLVLMSLEGGLPSACDAINRLVQLRKSVQHQMAA